MGFALVGGSVFANSSFSLFAFLCCAASSARSFMLGPGAPHAARLAIIATATVVRKTPPISLRIKSLRSPAPHEMQDNHDDGDHQHDVDETGGHFERE